jgi:hypothetical protein
MGALYEPLAAHAQLHEAPAAGVHPTEPAELPFWDLPSVWDLRASIDWLIPDMLPLRGVTLLSAASGTGKTWLAYAIAGAVAHGGEFLGRRALQRPVLYCDRENPAAIVKRNIEGLGISRTAELQVWGGWHTETAPGPGLQRLLEFAKARRPLLIWDSLVRFHTGDEQSAQETSAFMNHFRLLANAGATVLVLHHTGKSAGAKQYRGSSDIEAAVDMAYTLEGTPRNGELHLLTLRCFKSRFAPGRNFGMEFRAGRGFTAIEVPQGQQKPSAADVVAAIIAEHPGINGTEIKELAKPFGVGKNPVDAYLKTLRCVRGAGGKHYYPPPAAAAAEPPRVAPAEAA